MQVDQSTYWEGWHARQLIDSQTASQRHLVDLLITHMSTVSGRRVLELGCGQGVDAAELGRRGFTVEAVDFAQTGLRRGMQRIPASGGAVSFRRHDLNTPMPYPADSFDGCYSHLALHYYDDATTRRLFDQLRDVTTPDGVLAISVKSIADPCYGRGRLLEDDMYDLDGHVRRFFSESYLRELLEPWGLLLLESYRDDFPGNARPSAFLRAVARKPR